MNNALRARVMAALVGGLAALCSPLAMAEVKVTEAWARATPPGAEVAAIYLTVTNTGDAERSLLKIVSPASDLITLHRTSRTAQGTTRMWPMSGLAVEAGQTVRMEPHGLHVMLRSLKAPLVAGQKIPLTLKFDGGEPEFTLMVEVRPLVPEADEHAGH